MRNYGHTTLDQYPYSGQLDYIDRGVYIVCTLKLTAIHLLAHQRMHRIPAILGTECLVPCLHWPCSLIDEYLPPPHSSQAHMHEAHFSQAHDAHSSQVASDLWGSMVGGRGGPMKSMLWLYYYCVECIVNVLVKHCCLGYWHKIHSVFATMSVHVQQLYCIIYSVCVCVYWLLSHQCGSWHWQCSSVVQTFL